MRLKKPPIGFPCLVRLSTFYVEQKEVAQEGIEEIISHICDRYGSACTQLDKGLKLKQGPLEIYVEGATEGDYQTFLVALSPIGDGGCSLSPLEERTMHDEQMDQFMKLLPQAPLSTFDLRIARTGSEREAQTHLERCLDRNQHRSRSMGLVRGCLLAGLVKGGLATFVQSLEREFVLLPFEYELEQATWVVWDLCKDMASLASYAGRLTHLRSRHDLALRQIEASEQNTQMRINEILAGLRLPVEQIEPGRLEGILTEVTTLFARLSILVGAMRRDYVRAQALLRGVKRLFMMWNEEGVGSQPNNSSVETEACESLVAPFKDYIDRVEALRVQLNTVLDAVRTYLEIQGQKMSVEEQKSSREQLIRLVELQETLHKLEILIVAVYLTEMARIVFEAFIHERANVLTVGFIPFALLIAMLIGRLLHRES